MYYINIIRIEPTHEQIIEAFEVYRKTGQQINHPKKSTLFIYSLPDYTLIDKIETNQRMWLRPSKGKRCVETVLSVNELIEWFEEKKFYIDLGTSIRKIKIHHTMQKLNK